jgi:tRNA(Ile)-lysidine synthase TilS/MesJ
MMLCKSCVLPETFPGIRFNAEGICNYCLEFRGEENLEKKKQRYRKRFEELLQEYKNKAGYDALMSYSGGKDSTYTLAILKKEYRLNLLALTMDNGFLPEKTLKNIRKVVESLGIDHIFFKPRFSLLRKIVVECSKTNIYPAQTLIRASTICTSCMAIIKFITLRMAIEKRIPFIVFGWSPGQIPVASSIMKNNPEMLRVTQKAVLEPLERLVGNEIRPYFLEERHFKDFDYFPYNISPLAFLDYDEECILDEVSKLGWEAPKDVDANSTNCLLNSFANIVHKEQYGFHPYAFEMAKLVREGYLDRSVALQKISQPEDQRTVKRVKRKLGL